MAIFKCINVQQAQKFLIQGVARLVDIRDLKNFNTAHPTGAFHLTQDTLNHFMQYMDVDRPLLVMCYHGISSKNVAQYLINQGFKHVYSVDGGFTAWHAEFPQQVETEIREL